MNTDPGIFDTDNNGRGVGISFTGTLVRYGFDHDRALICELKCIRYEIYEDLPQAPFICAHGRKGFADIYAQGQVILFGYGIQFSPHIFDYAARIDRLHCQRQITGNHFVEITKVINQLRDVFTALSNNVEVFSLLFTELVIGLLEKYIDIPENRRDGRSNLMGHGCEELIPCLLGLFGGIEGRG